MKKLLILLLLPSILFAQTPTPTPDPEIEAATQLNISLYELKASKLLNLVNQLLSIKRNERLGQVQGLGEITETQKAALRARRLAARAQLRAFCDDLRGINE